MTNQHTRGKPYQSKEPGSIDETIRTYGKDPIDTIALISGIYRGFALRIYE